MLFTDQNSSPGSRSQMIILGLLHFLVSHKMTTCFTDDRAGRLLER